MTQNQWQAEEFERHRAHLNEVARRLLGSSAEAEDAVQEAWMRLGRSDAAALQNIRAWLTTVVSRICLDMLKARRRRSEELVDGWDGDLVVSLDLDENPEQSAILADSVGLALLVVLDQLSPPERLAFVLHDMFAVPFEEIAPVLERSVAATRQLASRARRRVQGADGAASAGERSRQREVVRAFLAASREGDFTALVNLLDPEVVLRADAGASGLPVPAEVHGAEQVARLVLARGTPLAPYGRAALVDGRPAAIAILPDRVASIVTFTIAGDRVVAMDVLVDPERLGRVRL